MKKYINIMMLAFSFVIFLYSLSFSEEQITITTYYPSPYGSYKELRADQMAIGSAYRTSTLADGNLLVSGKVGIGTAAPGSNLSVAGGTSIGLNYSGTGTPAPTNGMIIEGNVGIGTASPDAKLDVNGNVYSGSGESRFWNGTYSNPHANTAYAIKVVGSGGAGSIAASGNAVFMNGDVGIGTVSPTTPAPNNQPGNLDVNDIYLRSLGRWMSQGGLQTQIKTCDTGTSGATSNSCLATCDPGYSVVGGGCQAYESWWQVRTTIPMGNGWYCEVHEDYGREWYYQGGTGYAVCAR